MKRLYILLLIGLLILLVLPKFLSSYVLGIFIMIFFYAYLGQSWNILTGYTGVISLGHSLYVGIGAYMTFLLTFTLGLSPWIGMWIGGIAAGLIGLVIGYFGFRFGLKGVYFVLLTIAFAEIGRLIILHLKVFGSFQGSIHHPSVFLRQLPVQGEYPLLLYWARLCDLLSDCGSTDGTIENRQIYGGLAGGRRCCRKFGSGCI